MTNKILHILVIGFHHKKGCQVEFCYPPFNTPDTDTDQQHSSDPSEKQIENENTTSIECPIGWKYLPTLALPDGSHNFIEDSVFFNLPSLQQPNKSVYGISCYRQLPVEKLKNRTADVTRSTVQKSVCILATVPIYGYIEVKLSLIAHAFFDQGDFSNIDILIQAYRQLNVCINENFLNVSPFQHIYIGLPLRDIILKWRHKSLILFKLLLLQKKVIYFGSPVRPICSLILAIISLYPKLLENGFEEVACVQTSRPLSPMPNFTTGTEDSDSNNNKENNVNTSKSSVNIKNYGDILEDISNNVRIVNNHKEDVVCDISNDVNRMDVSSGCDHPESNKFNLSRESSMDGGGTRTTLTSSTVTTTNTTTPPTSSPQSSLPLIYLIKPPKYWAAPLQLFTNGNLCLPYLSLPYMDVLTDPSVLSYTIGTSNILFRQKRQLSDVLIDVENCTIETFDQDLKKQLMLTTEDLRFIHFIVRHVQMPKEDAEGSEQWIREQFQAYLLAILRTSLLLPITVVSPSTSTTSSSSSPTSTPSSPETIVPSPPTVTTSSTTTTTTTNTTSPSVHTSSINPLDMQCKEAEHFNIYFMVAMKQCQYYGEWFERYNLMGPNDEFENIPFGHPFAGTLSVNDMKLKLSQTMNNSESGRKLNQAVNTTSKALGGAILQAKGALSSWWSTIGVPTTTTIVPVQQQQQQQQQTTPSKTSIKSDKIESIPIDIENQTIENKKLPITSIIDKHKPVTSEPTDETISYPDVNTDYNDVIDV